MTDYANENMVFVSNQDKKPNVEMLKLGQTQPMIHSVVAVSQRICEMLNQIDNQQKVLLNKFD